MTYGSPEERQAWAAYQAATARRHRWYWPTLTTSVIAGVLAVVAIRWLNSPWALLLAPLGLLPHVVWRVTTVWPENRAGERWEEIMDREDGYPWSETDGVAP